MAGEFERRVPFSLEAEQSVLGSILIDPNCITSVAEIITADDFYREEHQHLYRAMQEMFLQNKSLDYVTLADTLVKMGRYDEAGGDEYIRLIAQIVPTAANVTDYAKIVREKSLLRRLIEVCDISSEEAYAEADEPSRIIDAAEQRIFDLAQGKETKNFVELRNVVVEVLDLLQRMSDNKAEMAGTPTGFSDLDKVLVGMGKGDLILIGARPGMGKTSFAMNIATEVAKRTKKTIAVFSLEMSAEQLVMRMLSSEAMVDSYKLRSGDIDREDIATWKQLAHAADALAECDILIDDTSGITVTGMKAKLRRVKNLGLVVIDYLQLMHSDQRIDNRVQEVAEISRNLKLLAKELEVPVITCAQLSRGPEQRTEKRPQLSDLRDSGAIEQDADVVMFIYREDYYKDSPETENKAES